VFGNDGFKESQLEIINAALSGKDVMALIPTGGGKSLCFQLPALLDKGYTFIIMPLISLIEDQAYQLRQRNIKAFAFSKMTASNNSSKTFFTDLLRGDETLKLIYLTPEKFVNSPAFMSVLDKLYQMKRISRFVIDEVHCVSHWGQDFRKDYRELSLLRMRYPKVPIIALTATATVPVKYDINQILKLN
jgi:RecQ family ATP-dependent DNA helicase